jgi:hypothetical protein
MGQAGYFGVFCERAAHCDLDTSLDTSLDRGPAARIILGGVALMEPKRA